MRRLRHQGAIPGVVYGHGAKTASVAVERQSFDKVYRQAGESSLVDLVVDGAKPVKVLIQEVQVHPLNGAVQHIDFHQVRMDEKLQTDVPLKFVGESKAVKDLGGILVKNTDHLKVECLPQDLVHELVVDISVLVELDQSLHAKDVLLPAGIQMLTSPGELIAIVTPPRSEAELAELKAEVKEDVGVVEKVETKKPAEGEAAEVGAEAPKAKEKS